MSTFPQGHNERTYHTADVSCARVHDEGNNETVQTQDFGENENKDLHETSEFDSRWGGEGVTDPKDVCTERRRQEGDWASCTFLCQPGLPPLVQCIRGD